MSREGSVKERIKQVDAKIDECAKKYQEANLPGPKQMYRMADDELLHHVHVLALTNLLKKHCGLTDDDIMLAIKEQFLEEIERIYGLAKDAQRQALQAELTRGITPGMIIRPPDGAQGGL